MQSKSRGLKTENASLTQNIKAEQPLKSQFKLHSRQKQYPLNWFRGDLQWSLIDLLTERKVRNPVSESDIQF